MSVVENDYSNFTAFPLEAVEQSIPERFEQQASLFPKRVAVADENVSFTYTQLNAYANKIAHAIMAKIGHEPSQRVVIYFEKSAAYIAAIMGILKAGHTYVPIDPAFPLSRNEYILSNSDASLIVTNAAFSADAEAFSARDIGKVLIDELSPELADTNPQIKITPDALAYIIYTSGSTGKPKGVMQNHRNTLHGCMRRTNLQQIVPDDRMTLFYSPSVMGSVYCIFGALLNGAGLYPYDIREEGLDDLAEWLKQRKITIYHSVASVFRQFARFYQGSNEDFSIQLVIFGGEKVLTSDVHLARKVFSNCIQFFTGLGSTETGTIRHFPIAPETEIASKVVPIGYPVEGVEIILTDDSGKPVATGDVGEITVHSPYIALGYWKDEENTQRAFSQPDPQNPVRIYRTGDMGQLDESGLLVHKGRKDFQVKIRGFRVEIGEVETALQDIPGVDEAVVIALDLAGQGQLVAYLTFKTDAEQPTVRQVRQHLQQKLPYYMVPSFFAALSEMPRTPNNKIDRKSLPQPNPEIELKEEELLAPASETEQLLVDICQELLAKKDYGVNRSFFEHGGDSLSATQLVARVNYKKGVKLGMQAVFTAEDLRVLAEHIDGLAPASTQNVIAPLKAETQNSRPSVSFAQRRMWLTTQLLGGSAAYNISNTVKLKGELNAAALEQALNRIVERQELLRARIPSDDNGPWLEIDPYRHMTLPLVDLQHLPPGEAEAKARQIAGEALAKPHDLAKGPLFEAQLLQIDDTTAMLVLVFNHIIYDNIWSSGIFFRELEAFYAQACGEVSVALPETPSIQFSDFARWEQQNASRDQDEHLQYWKKQLENLPEPLQVAGDYRRPETPSLSGGQVRFELPADIAGGIQFFAKSESATLFMVLMAAWQVLLARYSGQQDILVGTPTGRRYRTETENLIGLFINNLVIRTQLSAELSFRELLQKVRQTTIDAFAHDEIPFEKLVEEINPPRFSGVSPFFQHLFIHRNASKSQWSLPGVQVEPVALHPGGSKFDLTLSILEKHEAISGTLEYSRDLFSEDTVTRMAANYVELLASIIHSPDTLVDRLSLVAAEESRLVLNEWNQTRQDYPKDSCTYQLFEQIVEQYADKTALVGEDQTLSYADFNYKANQLAHLLRDKGVQPDDLVAVCVDRSADLIIALMAVFKAGAAYVPLDPHFPADRLSYMIENSQAKLFIAQSHILDRLPDLSATPILMDAGEREYDTRPGTNLTPLSGPDNLAYVIYTSGSTGKPKGVQITHRALVNFLCSMQDEPGLTPDDVMQAITTICFDIAALEIFLPLITGARVVVSSRETSIVAPRLLESIENNGATVMQATPVTWRMLIESGWRGDPKLRVFCGGEAMGTDLAAQLVDTGCEIWNLYGPTETTIWSTVCRINQASDATVIGHPIANTELLVCSPQLQLQPIGVPGELLIGGDGLARGYFKREDITKEKFIAHVFNDGERLYRTGDMVIRRPNGDIEFLGRMDNQVKIRGFRIELGDIETHIATFDDVQHAVVIAREDSPGEKRLVAYMISHSGDEISVASLRDYLKSRLPDYMVPAAFVTLAEFPQTPNGKVDRKQLPAPLVSSKPKAPPAHSMDTLGERVMAIFESVLGNSVTSVNDNFFDLGGHSLLALKAVEAINQQFSTNLSPAIIFDLQTPAELAAVLAQSQDGLLSSEDFAYPKTTPEEEALVDAMLAQIRALAKKSDSLNQNAPYMRESWLGKNLISKIYPGRRRSIRRLLEFILLRIEGGRAYSVTMRKLYKKLYNIEVGNYTNTRFDAVRLKRNTKIGKFCSIVRSASFQNADHPIKALSTHAIFYHKKFGFTEGFELDRKRLEIGNDVWIGEGARILYPTQKIGDGAVIASGAVVVEDVPPYAIVGGYPAQVLRYRFSKQTIDKLLELKWWDYPLEELHKVNGLFMQPLEGKGMR